MTIAVEVPGQVPWWKEPTREQWKAWVAAWLGWTLDAFDFTIFLLIMLPIAKEFDVPLTAVRGTSNSLAIGSMIKRKMVKSNASRVQPNQAATHAFHCSLVGSFHHGTWPGTSTAIVMCVSPVALMLRPACC